MGRRRNEHRRLRRIIFLIDVMAGFGGIFGGIDTLVFGQNSEDVYGSKPTVPTFPTVEEITKQTTKTNIAAFPQAAELAKQVNTFNQEQLDALIEKALPGASAQIQKNISAQLKGELPPDVVAAIHRASAERGVAGGFAGSGFQENLSARDLGLTSLNVMNQGLSSAENWLARSTAPQFDVTSMFVNPAFTAGIAEQRWNVDWLKSQVAAAPDPVARGEFDSTMALIGMVLSAYGGGAGYQGTYRPNYSGGAGGGGGSMLNGGMSASNASSGASAAAGAGIGAFF